MSEKLTDALVLKTEYIVSSGLSLFSLRSNIKIVVRPCCARDVAIRREREIAEHGLRKAQHGC
ncbi:hypothetical protein MSG28_005325 [Choristoneura fumiferana]|uniref:Uncharacterized protein n=1 Tax=Choristoneura fumiferana TaxID=7141 RepID=A0ACC0JQS8_CHOFU|nr:hypothetical protein MSG28_005325 [Choristoneura fumiferana]